MQDVGWRLRVDASDTGTPVFSPAAPNDPTMIKGRVEDSHRLVRDAQGEQVISQMYVMTAAPVDLGDIIVWQGREWPVLTVDVITGVMGEELHREVYL
jgi:hypothetical protein